MSTERSVGLDILRSLAIAWVLVSHCGDTFAAWRGTRAPFLSSVSGFFGVELFFVLSGFLIGRLLLQTVERTPTWRDWRVFLVRRWMRTLPLYYFWLAVLAVVWPPMFWVPGHAALWRALPWFATMMQNLAWPMVGGWFGVSWSLAVEEWFYLLFSSLLLGGAALFGRRPALLFSLALFLLVPPLLRWHLPLSVNWGEFTSKVVPFRLDAIGFGIAVAWLAQARSRLLARPWLLLTLGVALVAGIWLGPISHLLTAIGPRVQRTFLFDVGSLGFAMLLPAADRLRRAPGWIARPAARVAGQSYALYIVHLSLLEIVGYYRVTQHLPMWPCVAGCLAAMWLLSWASFRWLEQPLLRLRPPQREDQANRCVTANPAAYRSTAG